MATEIAIFKLKAGKAPEDANSTSGQVLKDTLSTLTEQKGFQRAYWGTELENPGTFRLFVDWDSVDAHIDFTKQDHYKPFLDRFGQIAEIDSAQLFHSHFTPSPPSEALSDHVSPTTEIVMIYVSTDYKEHDSFAEMCKQLVANIEKSASTYTASAGGWTVEDVPIPGTSEKGKAYVILVGWQSMEAHMEWRSSSAYGESQQLLEKHKDTIKHTSVVHFSGTQVTKEGGVGDISDGNAPSVQGEILNPQDGGKSAPKTKADGTTTKNNDAFIGAANSNKKERAGR